MTNEEGFEYYCETMPMTKPADKWMQKALQIDCNLSSEKTRQDFARALEATDKAARAEERERCGRILRNYMQEECNLRDILHAVARFIEGGLDIDADGKSTLPAAIRKGTDNGQG